MSVFIKWYKDNAQKIVHLLVLIPFLFVLITGLISVDFGYQWDEKGQLDIIKKYVRTGNLLSEWYYKPSLTSYVGSLAILPYYVPLVMEYGADWPMMQTTLVETIRNNPTFKLNTRRVMFSFATLSVLWVYILVFSWRKNHWEALLAAAMAGFSWEVNYHSRWISPDAIMMMFSTLTIMFAMLALKRERKKYVWLILAALAAGLTTSTKYPAGVVLFAVFLTGYAILEERNNYKKILRNFALVSVFYALGYFVSNPGTVLDFQLFIDHILYDFRVYEGGPGRQAANAGIEHFGLMLVYFAMEGLSNFAFISLFFSALGIVGGYAIYKESKMEFSILLIAPISLVLFFSNTGILFVRNILVVIPFLAILAARGTGFLIEQLKNSKWRYALGSLVIAAVLVNAAWIYYASYTIQNRDTDLMVRQFGRYLTRHADDFFLVSEELYDDLLLAGFDELDNLSIELLDETEYVADYYLESGLDGPGRWYVNWPGIAPKMIGPEDINADYYFNWLGSERILLMNIQDAFDNDMVLYYEKAGLITK